jgi:hypothetical protein
MSRIAWLTIVLTLVLFSRLDAQQEDRQDQTGERSRFPQVFTLPGIEFNDDQQKRVDELRGKYVPKLTEIQRRRNAVHTPEQRRARREALQTARDAGKRGAELRAAVDAAVNLTEQQQRELATLQQEQRELVAEIQQELRSLLTDEQRRELNRRGQRRVGQGPRTAPTHRDVSYGSHDRNVMDVWLAESERPTPVLVSIHRGGFRGGNKSVDPGLLRQCLDSGISVVGGGGRAQRAGGGGGAATRGARGPGGAPAGGGRG